MNSHFVIYNRLYGYVSEFSTIGETDVRLVAIEILKRMNLSSLEIGAYHIDIVSGNRREYLYSVEV